MNIIKCILITLVSLSLLTKANANTSTYYGTLRGGDVIFYKSIIPGVVSISANEGEVVKKKHLFKIESDEYKSKLDILKLRLSLERIKLKRIISDRINGKELLSRGFISNEDFNFINDQVAEEQINIKEMEQEIKKIEGVLALSYPYMGGSCIVRTVNVSDGQYIDAGTDIMKIETLDNFNIDIKIDPTSIDGDIKKKNITVKSLVSGVESVATVSKISGVNNSDAGIYGTKVITLSIGDAEKDFSSLLDTVFEVKIND